MYGTDRSSGFRSLMPAGGDGDDLDEQIVDAFAKTVVIVGRDSHAPGCRRRQFQRAPGCGGGAGRRPARARPGGAEAARGDRPFRGIQWARWRLIGENSCSDRERRSWAQRVPAVARRAGAARRDLLQRAGRRRRPPPGRRLRRRRRYPARLHAAGALSRHRRAPRRRAVRRGGAAARRLRGRDRSREAHRRAGARGRRRDEPSPATPSSPPTAAGSC